MRILEISGKLENTKEDIWVELGNKFKADILKILELGERFPACGECGAKFGYMLTWKTIEDDIHVFGDGFDSKDESREDSTETIILVDNALHKKESIIKLKLALKCLNHIEANRKKYYHIRK